MGDIYKERREKKPCSWYGKEIRSAPQKTMNRLEIKDKPRVAIVYDFSVKLRQSMNAFSGWFDGPAIIKTQMTLIDFDPCIASI